MLTLLSMQWVWMGPGPKEWAILLLPRTNGPAVEPLVVALPADDPLMKRSPPQTAKSVLQSHRSHPDVKSGTLTSHDVSEPNLHRNPKMSPNLDPNQNADPAPPTDPALAQDPAAVTGPAPAMEPTGPVNTTFKNCPTAPLKHPKFLGGGQHWDTPDPHVSCGVAKRAIFVRHALSIGNIWCKMNRRSFGANCPKDIPLSSPEECVVYHLPQQRCFGISQAEDQSRALPSALSSSIQVLLSSPLTRTIQTAYHVFPNYTGVVELNELCSEKVCQCGCCDAAPSPCPRESSSPSSHSWPRDALRTRMCV